MFIIYTVDNRASETRFSIEAKHSLYPSLVHSNLGYAIVCGLSRVATCEWNDRRGPNAGSQVHSNYENFHQLQPKKWPWAVDEDYQNLKNAEKPLVIGDCV